MTGRGAVRATLAAALVLGVGFLGIATGAAVAGATGATWSDGVTVDPLVGAPVALSCASPVFCAAILSGGSATTYNGTAWTTPATLHDPGVQAVSCPTATFCVATDATGDVLTYDGSGWSFPTALDPLADGSSSSLSSGVSCPTATFCGAFVGPDVLFYDGTTWGAPTVVDTAGQLAALSCASATSCVASDGLGASWAFNGSTWAAAGTVGTAASAGTAVSCASASFCVATGGTQVDTYDGSAWTSVAAPGGSAAGVSCPTVGFCMVGTADGALAFNGSTWSAPTATEPSVSALASCTNTDFCAVAGSDDGFGVSFYDGTDWTATTVVVPAAGDPTAISCSSATFCAVVDDSGDALTFNGSWSSPAAFDPGFTPGDGTPDVSCATRNFCVAVDDDGGQANAFTWNGTSWSGPVPLDLSGTVPTGVSCGALTLCVVVDSDGNATVFNGASWSAPVAIDPSVPLSGVSCTSATFCMAVGGEGDGIVYNGSTWTKTAAIGFPPSAVSCTSSSSCMVIGGTGHSYWFFGLPMNPDAFAAYNGTTWTDLQTFTGQQLTGLSCTSTTFCLATDENGPATDLYNGQAWAQTSLPTPAADAVSCANSSFCLAVTGPQGSGGGGDAYTYAPQSPPSLEVGAVTPAFGPATGGTPVTVTGAGFSGVLGVQFGVTAATSFAVTSPTQISAVAPPGAVGSCDVTVTTTAGTTPTTPADTFTDQSTSAPTEVPSVTSVTPAYGSAAGGSTVTVDGSNFNGAVAVMFGSTPATSFTVGPVLLGLSLGTQIDAVAPPHTPGTVDVRVASEYGTSATSSADQYTFEGAPTVTGVTPGLGTAGTGVTVTGTQLLGATGVSFGGTAASSFSVVSGTEVTAVAPAHATGTVDVTVVTPFGTSPTSPADQYAYEPPPSVTAVSPDVGPTGGGTSVSITGSSFLGATTVLFGTAAATSFSVVSGTEITATAPAHAAGTVDVTVVAPGGTAATTPADEFAYGLPAVTKVAPSSVSVAGGTTVTVTGTSFTGATSVTFGAVPASSFTVVSGTKLTAVAPAEAAGTVDLTVGDHLGTSTAGAADRVTFAPASVAKLSPASGTAEAGTPVTITGVSLGGATAVLFGGVPAAGFTVVSTTSVKATAPPEPAGVVDVQVVTPAGTTPIVPGDHFTYLGPKVTKVAPNSGSVAGGTAVVLTGTRFAGATAVTFGGVPAASFTAVSGTTIDAVSPPGSAGTVDVAVRAAAGTSTPVGTDHFTYLVPKVTKVSPNTGPVAGGTTVTVTGAALTGASAVTFGTTPAAGFTVTSATSITAVSPPGGAGTVDVRVTTPAGVTAVVSGDRFTYP